MHWQYKLRPSYNEVVKDQLYIGGLTAAQSPEIISKCGITHILSVCREHPSTGPNHLAIAVDDSEYEDLLIRLPEACAFIQAALDQGGRVFVHCVMGISRSATVLSAYLMKTRHISASAALKMIKQHRPQVHPNYGFIKQLDAFAECAYEPTPTHPVYLAWKRQQGQNVTRFLNKILDTVSIIPDELYLSSEFPDDAKQAECLLQDMGITHLLDISIPPFEIPAVTSVQHHRVDVSSTDSSQEDLFLALPGACAFVKEALEKKGLVLVYSRVESKACLVACAYLMYSKHFTTQETLAVLENALPLFSPSPAFIRQLDLFQACEYEPTPENPLVQSWKESELSPIDASSYVHAQMTASPASASSSCTASSTSVGLPADLAASLTATAASVLSETGIDMAAFGAAMANIGLGRDGVVVQP